MKSIHMGNQLPPFAFEGLDRLELERDNADALAARALGGGRATSPFGAIKFWCRPRVTLW